MYRIVGADQREYGPAAADQIRQWIAEGRANAQTKAQVEGATDWKPLSEFPEFAEALAAKAPPSPPVSPPVRGEGDRLADEIIARGYQLYIGDCFSRSWRLLWPRFWLLAGATALICLLTLGIHSVPILGTVAGIVLGFVLWGGLDLVFLRLIRNQASEVGTAFAGFGAAFVPLMLASIVSQALTSVGLLLCILPGIYLLVAWSMFTPLLILDKGLDFWQAMECSRRVVTRHWWQCFGVLLLSWLVAAAGLLGCCVGVLLTLPIAIGAVVYAYEDIFGSPPAPLGPTVSALVPSTPGASQPSPSPEPGPVSPSDSESSANPAPVPVASDAGQPPTDPVI